MKSCVVLSGAGISAESGIPTFRDSNGLWEGYDPMEVATPEAWRRDPQLVLSFYNERRQALRKVAPNLAHLALVELEEAYRVDIVTQNIDNLHERAGSTFVLHLHGELLKARSCKNEETLYELEDKDIALGDKCKDGAQLRPHVVWFGEAVPLLPKAASIVERADVLIVVGSSLQVYPAASLALYAPTHCNKYYVGPEKPEGGLSKEFELILEKAGVGIPHLVKRLLAEAKDKV